MERVFIYWDNSNIFIGAKNLAEQREASERSIGARYRVRIDFNKLYRLAASTNRRVKHTYVAGSTPPTKKDPLWNKLRSKGIKVDLFNRGIPKGSEQQVPDILLQRRMLENILDNKNPGIAVLLSGDGGFSRTLKRMHKKGWRIELLSWHQSCDLKMKEWVEQNGLFIALDDFYDSVTYMKKPAVPRVEPRNSKKLDLKRRPVSGA